MSHIPLCIYLKFKRVDFLLIHRVWQSSLENDIFTLAKQQIMKTKQGNDEPDRGLVHVYDESFSTRAKKIQIPSSWQQSKEPATLPFPLPSLNSPCTASGGKILITYKDGQSCITRVSKQPIALSRFS